MKTNLLIKSIFATSLSLASILITGCGEDYSGTFVGEAQMTGDSCTDGNGKYSVIVQVGISGDSVSFAFTKFISETTNTYNSTSNLMSQVGTINANIVNNTNFSVSQATLANVSQANVTTTGQINAQRTEIDNMNVQINGVSSNPTATGGTANQTSCQTNFTIQQLLLQQ